MSVSVAIHPSSSTLCMINDPDASTAYSLSGHVSVSLASDASFPFRTQKVLLRSLTLVFEGQAELISNETGYSSVRLCRLKRELAPQNPILLSNGGHEDINSPAVWNFVFDLAVPGWLPTSSIYGSTIGGETGTSYGLYAEARFTSLEDGQHTRSWSLSNLCSPLSSKPRSVSAPRKGIEVVRSVTPRYSEPTASTARFLTVQYRMNSRDDAGSKRSEASHILEKIEIRALIPEHIDVNDKSFTLALRLRTTGLSTEQEHRLRLVQFRLSLSQHELYSRRPFSSYISSFPLPSSQPDSDPLLNTHDLKGLYDMSLISYNFIEGLGCRFRSSFPLLSEKQLGRHDLPYGGTPLQSDREPAQEQAWTRMDVCVPFEHVAPGDDIEWEQQNGHCKSLRPDEDGPFLRVRHDLEVELTFAYDVEGTGVEDKRALAVERTTFNLPVKFVRASPMSLRDPSGLPAYSQLFYEGGERRTDNIAPLPTYTPNWESPEAVPQPPPKC